jgi:hypothetical protein
MLIKKYLAKLDYIKFRKEKEIIFNELLKKYNIDPHYTVNSNFLLNMTILYCILI